jgi:hypothetical protein
VQAAQQTAALNRVNQYTPQGSLVYSQDPGGQWSSTQTYSPAEQGLYNQQLAGQGIYANTALSQLGQAAGGLSTPINTNLGAWQQNVASANPGLGGAASAAGGGMNYPGLLGGTYASMAGLPNAAAAAATPTNTNFNDVRNQYIQSQMGLLQPTLDEQQQTLQSQLANQGISQGSVAYNNAMRGFGNMQGASYANILANAQSGVNQAIQGQAALQMQPIQAAAGYAGLLGQGANLAGANIANQQAQAMSPINVATGYQGLLGQQQNLTGAQIQQQIALRDQPMNEATALLTGQMIGQPQFQNVPQSQVAAPNVGSAYELQLQQQNMQYQAQLAQQQGMMGGIGGILGTVGGAAMFGSDERLKTDIKQVGSLDLPGGKVGIHSFRFKGSPVRNLGLLAQEIEPILPGAVQTHPITGIKSLDYAQALMAAHGGSYGR